MIIKTCFCSSFLRMCRACALPFASPWPGLGGQAACAKRAPALGLLLLLNLLCLPGTALADEGFPLDFTTIRLGSDQRAVLVMGGIQGDEPGGFSAATLLATRYEIQSGAVWVVPNLNFPSIIKRSRGLHGDMNRKFARLDGTDPQFPTVRRIQEMIRHPQVGLVLNLHDGSGYYRPTRESALSNPARWGQSVIIDQEGMEQDVFMGALEQEAQLVTRQVNQKLLKSHHTLYVRNTKTASGDREMEKSLSYFAVRHGKAAFGLEASKEFPVDMRAYYHLCMVEAFLQQAGVQFARDFELSPQGVSEALRANLGVSFADNRVFLPLEDVRPAINYLPLPKGCAAKAVTSKPIMAVLPCPKGEDQICIHYGNRTITLIKPDWRDMDHSLAGMRVSVDGHDEDVPFGRVLQVEDTLRVHSQEGFRVNAIGFDSERRDESNLPLRHKNFLPRFSLDRQGTMFRIEVYKNQQFSGMFLVRFGKKNASASAKGLLPDGTGPESELGF